jgi:hypothetical protein
MERLRKTRQPTKIFEELEASYDSRNSESTKVEKPKSGIHTDLGDNLAD